MSARRGTPVPRAFFARPVLDVTRDLLGCVLTHNTEDGCVAGIIVEAEAYGSDDPASHAFRGMTPRNAPMFEAPGRAYVYFTYGMHFCFCVVCESDGVAGAVLVRAVEPTEGIGLMRKRRPGHRDRDLARGPGRLTKAFGIGREQNRLDLRTSALMIGRGSDIDDVATTPRIGLGSVQDGRPWRFVARGSSEWTSGPRSLMG